MDCDLSNFFTKVGNTWVLEGKDGTVLPILYCPVCGNRLYENDDKEGKE